PPSTMTHQLSSVADCALGPEKTLAIDSNHLNHAADALSRQVTLPRRMETPSLDGPADMKLVRRGPDRSVCLPLIDPLRWYSLTKAPLGTAALTRSWPRGPRKYERLPASTLKLYVAAVAVNHDLVDSRSLGKHDLIIRFVRGTRRINPPRPRLIPS
ncbi:hypothetical protein M9458_011981, partial [Cirrhinus mrigala]